MAKPVTTDAGPVVQVSLVLDSGMFLTDAASPEEPFAEIGYFLPHIVVYGDYSEMVTDGSAFYAIWAEGESTFGTGDVYYAKF